MGTELRKNKTKLRSMPSGGYIWVHHLDTVTRAWQTAKAELTTTSAKLTRPMDPLAQGWGTKILEGHSPAEYSSNPEKP